MFPLGALIFSTAPFLLAHRLFALGWIGFLGALIFPMIFLFPIVLLGMAQQDSPVNPFSRPVWYSLRLLPREWLKFYAALLPAWLLLVGNVILAAYWPSEWVMGFLGVVLLLIGVIEFRLLGRMAWVLGQKLPPEAYEPDPSQEPD